MAEGDSSLDAELRAFVEFFDIRVPAGMSVAGLQRFQAAYLRDPQRLARWQARASPVPVLQPIPSPPVPAPVAGTPAAEPLRFSGSGSEYFRIWIVNLLLSLLTLGIYSAWAKVRRTQYFYRNTSLAGARFDYHGRPLAILKGRCIGLGLLVAYQYSFQVSLTLGFVTLGLLALVLPTLLRNSFRFRLHNSSYRGLRFSFRGSTKDAYKVFAGYGSLAFVIALFWPLLHHRMKRYQHDNSWFGQTRGSFDATYREFSVAYAHAIGVVLLAAILGAVLTAVVLRPGAGQGGAMGAIGAIYVVVLLGAVGLMQPYLTGRLQNVIWNHTRLGEHGFRSEVSVRRLVGIQFSNLLLITLTLGIYWPWAAVRTARYRIESLALLPAGDLEAFMAAAERDVRAVGDETAELFDLDIAL